MDLEMAIKHALDGNAVLFAGSGFSYGAKNLQGEYFPIGQGLADALAKDCDLKSGGHLGSIATLYQRRKSKTELITKLKSIFTLNTELLLQYHIDIMSVNWKGIFTTNYDRIIEESASRNSKILTPIMIYEEVDNSKKENCCVHFNGFLDDLNEKTLDKGFVLTNRSYLLNEIKGNFWIDYMIANFKAAEAIIIIGFSTIYDLELTRIISEPRFKNKVVLICSPDKNEEDELLSDYGTVASIGVEGFANAVNAISLVYAPKEKLKENLLCFQHNYDTNNPPSIDISYDELHDLFYKGKLSLNLYYQNRLGQFPNLVFRSDIEKIVKYISSNPRKVYMILSSLGNGKTIFCELLMHELCNSGYESFFLKDNGITLYEEIDYICSIKNKVVVFIENYYSHYDILKYFASRNITNVIFVLSARNSLNNLNKRKLSETLHISFKDIYPVIIDKLNDIELENLSSLMERHKFFSTELNETKSFRIKKALQNNKLTCFSDIVLELFKGSHLFESLNELYRRGSNEGDIIKRLSIMAMVTSYMNLAISYSDITFIFDVDHIKLEATESEYLNEIFDVSTDNMKVRSSIISKYMLYEVVEIDDFINTLAIFIEKTDKLINSNIKYTELMKSLISHTHFIKYIEKGCQFKKIIDFYERIRKTSFCNNNLFFWEQFGLSYIDAKIYDKAQQCLDNAYVIAKQIHGFVPFMIDTAQARLSLDNVIYQINMKSTEPEKVINAVTDAHHFLTRNYNHPDNNHLHIFREGYKYVIISRLMSKNFDKRHKSIILEKMRDIEKRIVDDQSKDKQSSGILADIQSEIEKIIDSIK